MKSVAIVTLGRCGTHWLSRLLHDLLDLEQLKTHNWEERDIAAIEAKQPGGKIYLSHDLLAKFAPIADIVDIIAMVRDPRDALISAAWYWVSNPPGTDRGRFRVSWNLDLPDDSSSDAVFATLKQAGYRMHWLESYLTQGVTVLHTLVKFEDMHVNVRVVLEQLFRRHAWFWPDEKKLKKAIHRASFFYRSDGRDRGDERIAHHYRRGIVGEWKEYFTEAENVAFCKRFAHIMGPLGYA